MTTDMPEACWYHGSPHTLHELRTGSTITQHRRLAEVFSHKPALVCIDDDGTIQHDGRLPGMLYRVDNVEPGDIIPHPRTSMAPGLEWVTTRPLQLSLIGPVATSPDEFIPADMMESLQARAAGVGTVLSPGFRLHPFTPADQIPTRLLILEGLGERWGYIDATCNPDLDDITATYVRCGHHVIVAEDENGIIGTGTLVVDNRQARMVRVSVQRSARERGIGSAIVRSLVQMARERGAHRIEVETNIDWRSAIRLYMKNDFIEYNRDDESVYLALELE